MKNLLSLLKQKVYCKATLLSLLMLVSVSTYSQFGTYSPTVSFTTSNPSPTVGDFVSYCVTVTNFTECNFAWMDGFEIGMVGCIITSYDSSPNSDWLFGAVDAPVSDGWFYDFDGNGLVSDDWGHSSASEPIKVFCFTVEITAVVSSIDISLWSDFDTGGYTIGCGVAGVADGGYNILTNNVLPIDLLSFDALCLGGGYIDLVWVTVSELNNSHFDIEYSLDGITWSVIHSVSASGNSSQELHYSYFDYGYTQGVVSYYRLVQYDNDGVFELFSPVSCLCGGINEKVIVGFYNYLGQELSADYHGLCLVVYADGSSEQLFKK